jgi:sodium-dependent dicarboxylate transporter 2/3/5
LSAEVSVGLTRDHRRRSIGLAVAVVAFLVILILPAPDGLSAAGWRVAALAMLLAALWLSEALPVPATALLPLALIPTLGISPIAAAAAPYANPLVFLFLGGFLIALGIERWNLHRRIALNVLLAVGGKEHMQIGGFMIATAALSMWVSNTATAVMMLPVALSIIPRGGDGNVDPNKREFAAALLLAVAYSANIGGVATLIGTPPNALLAGFMNENYGIDIGFAQWLIVGMPVSLTMLVICWFLLTRVLHSIDTVELPGARETIRRTLEEMGPPSQMEKRVGVVFGLTALLWITRPVLTDLAPGLQLSDTGIAIAGALLLFVIPTGREKGERLLTWEETARLPWGVLLLFGGGLSLAAAVSDSGLAQWIGDSLVGLGAWPVVLLVFAVTLLIIFLTELTSNLATTATFLPLVAALAVALDQNPLLLSIPAVVAASFAFMLPVATPPNAIVFASGYIRIPQMALAGIWLNLIGAVAVIAIVYLLMNIAFSL